MDSQSVQTWMAVLDQIERLLQQSLDQAPEPAPPEPAVTADGPGALERLEDRLARWLEASGPGAADAGKAEEELALEESSLAGCLERVRATRETLAEWTTRAV